MLSALHFHDLRHTFASWAIPRRVTPYELTDLLGHSSLAMVKRYAHLTPEQPRTAAAALDGLLGQDASSTQEIQPAAQESLARLVTLRKTGEPSRDRTEDPLIKRREPLISRLSVFLRSSAQARVAA